MDGEFCWRKWNLTPRSSNNWAMDNKNKFIQLIKKLCTLIDQSDCRYFVRYR